MMKLMIVESPNKVKKIREILTALGGGWDVAASVGHIRDLPAKELGLEMPGYRPQYELSERGADVVKTLRARAAKADQVYLATDPDREGEAIAWHVAEVLRLRRAQRVSFDAITPEVIRRALTAPRQIDSHLVHAQEARRVLDRLVGYQVSPVLSRQAARHGLSAGRVQSPAVRLVVDREREIEAFREVRHFGAELSFDGGSWRAQWEMAPFLKKVDGEEQRYILDEPLAARAAACRECKVLASANRLTKQPPPPPFTTSTMLQAASVQLRWKPDVTAQVAQRLFEAGLITYHRTDSQNFSAEALREVRGYATGQGLPLPDRARSWRARGNAQEAHEAIRPTHFASEHAGEEPAQKALYRLIWLRAVASQLADAEWSVNTTRLESKNGSEMFTFKAEGRVLVAPGWRALTAKDGTDEAEEEDAKDGERCGRVPVLAVGAGIVAESGRVLHKKTQPPPRYTQATLIKKLESIGIGRPSTYPAILKNVQTRGYLQDSAKYLRPTELGCLVVDSLVNRFSFAEYAFTRALEEQLDEIAEGKAEYLTVVSAADERLQQELQALGGASPALRATGAGHVSKASDWRPSPTTARGPSSRWPARVVASPALSRPETGGADADSATGAVKKRVRRAAAAAPETATARTKVKRSARKRSGAIQEIASSGEHASGARQPMRKGTAAVGPLPCPLCKAGFVRLPREDAKAFGCSAYADTGCRFTVWRTIAGREMSELDVAALCRDGRTGVLRGFVSKAGKPFEASLVLSGEGKVEFSFAPRG